MAVPVRSRPERVYVNVVLSVDSTGFMKPSAVRRMRLHSLQKLQLTGEMSPTLPMAPGRA